MVFSTIPGGFGLVSFGMVWFGMVWYGMVWYVTLTYRCPRCPHGVPRFFNQYIVGYGWVIDLEPLGPFILVSKNQELP